MRAQVQQQRKDFLKISEAPTFVVTTNNRNNAEQSRVKEMKILILKKTTMALLQSQRSESAIKRLGKVKGS